MGDVKLDSEYTQEDIMKDYSISDDLDDLFNSDILVLETAMDAEILDIETEYKELNVKHYDNYQREIETSFFEPITVYGIIQIGVMVISTLSSLITLGDFINKRYGNKGDTKINITVFNKTVNNTYIHHHYKGDSKNFCENVIEEMKNDYNYQLSSSHSLT